ncbi:MAG: AAA family ATPase [Betaproteobacteria bacterium]|nr:AAA family ATPase [Betaproteobacteria bacterium]
MKLLSLSATNFMPYKGQIDLTFPTDPDRNVMVVFGENMRGKTSILNALRWGFYGRALGRHSREIPLHELLNKEAALEGDCQMDVAITFDAEGHRYELRRRATKRPLVSRPTRSEDFEVVRLLRKDGMVVGDHMIDAEINRFAPEQVSRFFLFDGELLQEYESLLIEGSEQGRKIKEAIEQILGVPTLIHGRDEAQTLLKGAQKQQSKDLEKVAGLEKQTERQKQLQSHSDSYERALASLGELLKTTRRERAELDDFIEATDSIHQAKADFNSKTERRNDIDRRQEELSSERLLLIKDAWRELLRPQLDVKHEQLTFQRDRLTAQLAQKGRLESRIEQLRESLQAQNCQACGQPIHEQQRTKVGRDLGALEAELRAVQVDSDELARITAEIRDLSRLLRAGPAVRLLEIDKEFARLAVELTRVENEIEKLTDQIRGHDTAEIARKRALRDGLLKEEGKIERDMKDTQSKLDAAKRDLAMIARALENVPEARATRSSQMVRLYGGLERIFARSVDRLRDDLKARVESLATEAFKRLTTQKRYSGLRINSNYGLMILDEFQHEVTVRSAGAEQIVALSLIDGLSRAGRAAGPVVMDTPFGRLDPKHRANILSYLPSASSQLVLLVHEGEVRREGDLDHIASRIGCVYDIKEVNPRHSRIERITT